MQAIRHHESEILRKFTSVYCRKNHYHNRHLCDDCEELLECALERLEHCPYDPKPICRRCPTHCYEPEMRERMRQVMQFSGRYFVKRGRVDWLVKYFLLTRRLNRGEVNLRSRADHGTEVMRIV